MPRFPFLKTQFKGQTPSVSVPVQRKGQTPAGVSPCPGTVPYSNQRGQIAIMVALITVTLMVLVALVINVGVLVHAKVNLQNSADMAAMAGAAQQAKILTEIGRKNFLLRQNYKEFLYLYWVLHNKGNYHFDQVDQDGKPHIASFCIPELINKAVKQNIEVCGKSPDDFERIQIHYSPFVFGPGSIAANIATAKIEGAFAASFKNIEQVNLKHAQEDIRMYAKNADTLYKNYIVPLGRAANGIPISPARKQYWLQQAAPTNQRIHDINRVTIPSPHFFESFEKIAAETAIKNLSPIHRAGVQKSSEIVTHLRPRGRNYLDLSTIAGRFRPYYVHVHYDGSRIVREDKPVDWPEPGPKAFVFGVQKNPRVKTYYAIKLKSKPKAPFLPNAFSPELVAYAAAKPFGSRVGPANPKGDPWYPTNPAQIPNASLSIGDGEGFFNFGVQSGLEKMIERDPKHPNPSHKAIPAVRYPNEFEMRNYTVTDEDMLNGVEVAAGTHAVQNRGSLRTGFARQPDGSIGDGRVGYSVKLIPLREIFFDSLNKPTSLTEQWKDELKNVTH